MAHRGSIAPAAGDGIAHRYGLVRPMITVAAPIEAIVDAHRPDTSSKAAGVYPGNDPA